MEEKSRAGNIMLTEELYDAEAVAAILLRGRMKKVTLFPGAIPLEIASNYNLPWIS